MSTQNPYEALPYRSLPIEWTAPERLALAALLHGGPRTPLDAYRVLELGCAGGANLLPLAFFRRQAAFTGVDGAGSQIRIAEARRAALGLSNLEFIHADFMTASRRLFGQFDYIIAHGVFSWTPDDVRDAMFELCARHLSPEGLLYLNYNSRPGWNVRGLVREFLLAQTAEATDLPTRARLAQEVAARVVSSLLDEHHPYSQLIASEFRFVCENHVSHVAHEYLAADNHAYWRSDFLNLACNHGFDYVADADFNYPSRRISEQVASRLLQEQIRGRTIEDTVDLLCYRQLHSPILAHGPLHLRPPSLEEFANLQIASCLEISESEPVESGMFQHPTGYRVETKDDAIRGALAELRRLWPRSRQVATLFADVRRVIDDLQLLHRNGMIELRRVDPGETNIPGEQLNALEREWGDYVTSPYHTREAVSTGSTSNNILSESSSSEPSGQSDRARPRRARLPYVNP